MRLVLMIALLGIVPFNCKACEDNDGGGDTNFLGNSVFGLPADQDIDEDYCCETGTDTFTYDFTFTALGTARIESEESEGAYEAKVYREGVLVPPDPAAAPQAYPHSWSIDEVGTYWLEVEVLDCADDPVEFTFWSHYTGGPNAIPTTFHLHRVCPDDPDPDSDDLPGSPTGYAFEIPEGLPDPETIVSTGFDGSTDMAGVLFDPTAADGLLPEPDPLLAQITGTYLPTMDELTPFWPLQAIVNGDFALEVLIPKRTPDRTQLACMSVDSRLVSPDTGGGPQTNRELLWVSLETGEVRRLTDLRPQGRGVVWFWWSQDGTKIAMITHAGDFLVTLEVLDLATGERRAITDPTSSNDRVAATFSPDGRYVAYSLAGRLYRYDLEADERRLLLEGIPAIDAPDWHPTEDRIVFVSGLSLAETDSEGSSLTVYDETYSSLGMEHPDWSPDGRFVLFSFTQDTPPIDRALAILDPQTRRVTHIDDTGVTTFNDW